MDFLLLGQSLEDHIIYNGNTTVKPGGIFYSVLGLKSFLSADDKLFLCTSMGKNKKELFSPLYDDLDKSYFNYVEEIPKVYLNITDEKERGECYSLVNQNLSIDKIINYEVFDGVLVNMITGFDITLDQLKELRSKFSGEIFFDVHTFARGLEKDGSRKFRIIPGFEKWAENIDILQVNETEFSNLFDLKEEKKIVNKLFEWIGRAHV